MATTFDTCLRYLDADRVDTPLGRLTAMTLSSPSDKLVGSLSGILFDPIERRVRYFVVTARRWWAKRQYLLPAAPMPIDAERRTLQVELEPDEVRQLPRFQADEFPKFSDDDLLNTLFPSRAA